MGWLGWTEKQTLETSMPAIAMAYEARQEMLRNVVQAMVMPGIVPPAPEAAPVTVPTKAEPVPVTVTPQEIKSVFRMAAGKK
jgi:hypothetical protein